jgi:hypothetical protein
MPWGLLVWSPLLLGAVQVPILFATGRNAWPFLRKHMPKLLAFRGVPFFTATVILVVLFPAAIWIAHLAPLYGIRWPRLIQGWLYGDLLGFAVSVAYYALKDLRERERRSRAKKHRDA